METNTLNQLGLLYESRNYNTSVEQATSEAERILGEYGNKVQFGVVDRGEKFLIIAEPMDGASHTVGYFNKVEAADEVLEALQPLIQSYQKFEDSFEDLDGGDDEFMGGYDDEF